MTKSWKEDEVTYLKADNATSWDEVLQSYYPNDATNNRILGGGDYNLSQKVVSSNAFIRNQQETQFWLEFDVTDIAKAMIADPSNNNGFILMDGRMKSELQGEISADAGTGLDAVNAGEEHPYVYAGKYNSGINFYSSDYQGMPMVRPKLTIEYK